MLTENNVYNWLIFISNILPETETKIQTYLQKKFKSNSTYRVPIKKRNNRLYKEFFY